MFYDTIKIDGVEFPITNDGILLNPRLYNQYIDGNWQSKIIPALAAYELLTPFIDFMHHSGIGLPDFGEEAIAMVVTYFHELAQPSLSFLSLHSWLHGESGSNILELSKGMELLVDALYELMTAKPQSDPAPKQVAPQNHGYVYLIASSTGNYKIGKTKNPNDRLKTFGVLLPFEIEPIHIIECQNYHQAERKLHKRFNDRRVNGEWFALTPEEVEEIKAISEM